MEQAAREVETDDALLVQRVQGGEAAAFDALVLRYQDRIYNLVRRMVGDDETARDLAQDVFLKAYRAMGSFKGDARFFTWLYRIALNTATSERRKLKVRRVVSSLDRPARAEDGNGGRPEPEDRGRPPDQVVAGSEVEGLIQAAIMDLDEEHRAVVVLKDIEDRDYEEIAAILGVPKGTVKSRLHRARVMLRQRLEPLVQ
ncbi:MAG: sigma-70 family RNA polymerase sigma factor [Planctomycetes bacterium]|nr:sigma-70 family RNA polymerase sigma factor [Planctomycetota bacterium]